MTNTSQHPNRRRFQRVHFESSATLCQNENQASIKVLDLSLKGVLVDEFDTNCFDLTKSLQLTIGLVDNVDILMDLFFVHRNENEGSEKYGFRCDGMDIDSIAHLRRLVELNLGSTHALDRELSELFDHLPAGQSIN